MAKGNPIPSAVRRDIWVRDQGRCTICGGMGEEINHRIRRREGGHSRANLHLVCSTDHQRLHSNPEWARDRGYIVSAVQDVDPASLPLRTWRGWAMLRHDGSSQVIAPANITPDNLEGYLLDRLQEAHEAI